MLDPHFAILGALISVIGSLTYVKDVLGGKAKPNRVTWFMWTLAPMIAFAAELNEGVGLQSLLTFSVGFGPLLIFCSSFSNKQAIWKITKFDVICGLLSFTGLILWLLTRHGVLAIGLSIASDLIAGLPTIIKSYKYPETESWGGFFGSAINGGIVLLTIDNWTFAIAAFPIYIFLICILQTTLVGLRPQQRLVRIR